MKKNFALLLLALPFLLMSCASSKVIYQSSNLVGQWDLVEARGVTVLTSHSRVTERIKRDIQAEAVENADLVFFSDGTMWRVGEEDHKDKYVIKGDKLHIITSNQTIKIKLTKLTDTEFMTEGDQTWFYKRRYDKDDDDDDDEIAVKKVAVVYRYVKRQNKESNKAT